MARLQWAAYRRRPWLAQVISLTRAQLLPSGLAHTDWAPRAVADLGLEPNVTLHAAMTATAYVRGIAVNLEPEAEARQDTGLTDDE